MHKSKRVLIPLIVISALAITGLGWYFTQETSALAWGTIEAAGTVEAVEVSIASELSGRVLDVLVSKGAGIDAGEVLVRLDDELLQSQRQRAVRAVEAAQANLVSAQSGVELAKSALSSAEAALRIAGGIDCRAAGARRFVRKSGSRPFESPRSSRSCKPGGARNHLSIGQFHCAIKPG